MIYNEQIALKYYPTDSSQSDVFFNSSAHIHSDISELLRIEQLREALKDARLHRTDLIQKIKDVSVHHSSDVELAKNELISSLGLFIEEIYAPSIHQATTIDQVSSIASRILKDVNSLVVSPLQKSFRGNKGPTFLVHYLRGKAPEHSYVIKWTKWNEICCTRLYQYLSMQFPSSQEGFLVPRSSGIDCHLNILDRGLNKSVKEMDRELSDQLNRMFHDIATNAGCHTFHGAQIMLSERILGENILDFAYTKYPHLTQDQKKQFFKTLGRIAFLDVLVGNLDRFVQIFYENGVFGLMDLEANLGNGMIRWTPNQTEPLLFYAIDNGITEEKLIIDPAVRQAYLYFLESIFNASDPLGSLVENMVSSFQSACETQIDDCKGNVQEIRVKMKDFKEDLQTIASEEIRSGMFKMADLLQNQMLSKENYFELLNGYFSLYYPELSDAINERFGFFKNNFRKSKI